MNYFETVKSGKRSRGKNFLLKHLKGERINRCQAIEAKCYDCMGNYNNGAVDCESPECPLYPFMPYQKNVICKNNRIISEGTRKKNEEIFRKD